MNIKLIQPKMTLRPMDSEYKRAMAPSLALLTLAALTPIEHNVFIEDENVEDLRLNDRPDLVGITMNLDTSQRACRIASVYRERNIPVIAGGIHASAQPQQILQYFDSVCIGEAEEIWEDVIKDAQNKCLKKIYQKPCASMEKTPPPAWEKIRQDKYLYTNIVCTGRGCPFSCEFCYNSCDYILHKTRNKPYAHVIDEISRLHTKHVMFIDDNFIGDITWTKGFLKEIQPLNLKWNAAVSQNLVHHPDLLDQMHQSGCKSLFIGFESINGASINLMQKKQNNIGTYERLIKEIHEWSIMINASLVFGFDGDQPDVFEKTLNWLVENRIETMTAHILTPYPGTRLYKRMLDENRIIDFDSDHYNTSHVVFRPRNMTADELLRGYLWIYRSFYSLKNIMKRLPQNAEQRMPFLLFNFVYRKFGGLSSLIAKAGWMNRLGRLARKLSYGI